MWEQGRILPQTAFEAAGEKGSVPVQTRELAFWPDGSVKWARHTACSAYLGEKAVVTALAEEKEKAGEESENKVRVEKGNGGWEVGVEGKRRWKEKEGGSGGKRRWGG